MSAVMQGLMAAFRRNQEYGERLAHDLTDDHMVLQPDGLRDLPVNHPAWAYCHLNIYLEVIRSVILGEPFDDPRDHRFGMNSRPQADLSPYGTREQIIADWSNGHRQIIHLLETTDDRVFDQPVQLERWSDVMPNAGICLPYLMLNHENVHLGQISAWRRMLGLPSV